MMPITGTTVTVLGQNFMITEKMANRYGFRVSPDANKLEIKKAVQDMYNVTVADVNTINYSGTVSYTHLDVYKRQVLHRFCIHPLPTHGTPAKHQQG